MGHEIGGCSIVLKVNWIDSDALTWTLPRHLVDGPEEAMESAVMELPFRNCGESIGIFFEMDLLLQHLG